VRDEEYNLSMTNIPTPTTPIEIVARLETLNRRVRFDLCDDCDAPRGDRHHLPGYVMDRSPYDIPGHAFVDPSPALSALVADGNWLPANGGTEQVFNRSGWRLLYVWQPLTGRHAYLDCDRDVILTDAEALAIFSA
jgi:hypothetical protein